MNHRKRLISNFLSLSSIQIANYILPLVTVPYLVRVFGPEKFGLIAFSQAFIQYFVLFTDYGFNLSATREISIYRENKEKISEIFCSIMLIKTVLMIFSFLMLCLLVFNISKFRTEWLVYFLTFGTVVGNVLFPIWFFQGMERMKYIVFLNFLSKAFFTLAIFAFIEKQSDYLYVPLISSLGFIATGILSLQIVWKNFKINFKIPTITLIIEELKSGLHIFISSMAISLYTVSTSFALGIFTNNTIVGYYSAGEKIISALVGLIGPFSQTVFPYISKLASESKENALEFLGKLVPIALSFALIISFLIFIFSDNITLIILGDQYYESILVLKILSFLPFVIFISNILGTQIMITFNLLSERTKVIIFSGILNIVLLFIFVPLYKNIGASISIVATEITVALGLGLYAAKHNIISTLLKIRL